MTKSKFIRVHDENGIPIRVNVDYIKTYGPYGGGTLLSFMEEDCLDVKETPAQIDEALRGLGCDVERGGGKGNGK